MRRLITGIVGLAITSIALGQSWTGAYDAGLKAAKGNKWEAARKAFLQAKAYRQEDTDKPTMLPGPVTEQRKWRNGSPYSPNFLAAYSSYRIGMEAKGDEATSSLNTAADELETLINKKQVSREAVFYLNAIYGRLNQPNKKSALAAKLSDPTWKVDDEIIAPEDLSAMNVGITSVTNSGIVSTVDASKLGSPMNTGIAGGPVPVVSTKYALIISNGDNKLPGQTLSHAVEDANMLKDTLTTTAGYNVDNIVIVTNANAAKMAAAAKDLATKMPAEATLFFFYTGAGANVDGRDWFASPATEIATDTSSMLRKTELFAPFTTKGISVFAFYQVPRPAIGGHYFGEEELKSGRVSQMQSTMTDGAVYSIFRGGKTVGVFADAISQVLTDLHSNAVPIGDFGWAVFRKIRQGGVGESGGGSRQTPTLPVLQFLSANSRF